MYQPRATTRFKRDRKRLDKRGHELRTLTDVMGKLTRGDAEPDSDVDLLGVLHGEVSASAEIGRLSASLAELSLRHDTVVSCVFVSEASYRTDQSPFLLNVRREGVAA